MTGRRQYWRVFHPIERPTYPFGDRPWPAGREQEFSREYNAVYGEFKFSADDPRIEVFVQRCRDEYGEDPFSYLAGKYRKGEEDEYPFYFFPTIRAEVKIADGVVFENQLCCGNPVPSLSVRAGQGCDQGKRQIGLFRLPPRMKKIPSKDFFYLMTGPRLAQARTVGVSSVVRDAFVEAAVTGCEFRPILRPDGEAESGLHQLTITGSTQGAIEISRPLAGRVIYCEECNYWFGMTPDPFFTMRSYPRDLFSDLDFQVCDRLRVRGTKDVIIGGEPFAVISSKVAKIIASHRFTGLDRKGGGPPVSPVTIQDPD